MNLKLFKPFIRDDMNYLDAPGTANGFIDHPTRRDKCVHIGIVMQHRFAFYYWAKWKNDRKPGHPVPNLLTVDWHDDVGADSDVHPASLKKLNLRDEREIGLYCWLGLCSNNDGQIKPAQYLNAIGDVYVILKQHEVEERTENPVQPLKDLEGNLHNVTYYPNVKKFLEVHGDDAEHPCIFDLDLDYFTVCGPNDERGTEQRVTDREIRKVISPSGPLMQWVFPRLDGMTIALEPEYCGGILNCAHILNVVSSTLCDPPMLTAGMKWRR